MMRHWTFREREGAILDGQDVHRGWSDYIAVIMPKWYALQLVQSIAVQLQDSENDGMVEFTLAGLLEEALA